MVSISVEVVVKDGALVEGTNEMDVIVHNAKDRDVVDARIKITPWMPEHGHGVKTVPKVTKRGGGIYSVKGLDITLPGKWELKMHIKGEGKQDTVTFSFMVDKQQMGHMDDMHEMGAMGETGHHPDAFWAHEAVSMRKLFHARYKAQGGTLTMNKLHSWLLNIKTPSGEPVTGAAITVDGGMPMHGHGLPTNPIATVGKMPGHYVIEGMKFTMPGHWVVKLNVEAGDKKDTIEFNLMLP